MTTDGSMAVWSNHVVGGANASAEVHFNYWRITGDPTFTPQNGNPPRDFVEVGVLLNNPAQVEQVRIYLPGNWDVEDCGPRFASPDIAQGIFNEQLTSAVPGAPEPERVDLMRPSNTIFCRVHRFPKEHDAIDDTQLTETALGDGILLTICRPAIEQVCTNLPAETPVYFRLRAYLQGQESPFVKRIEPTDRWFQSGYSAVDYLDFRLNEARSLPRAVENLMRAAPRVPHKLVAFLTAVPVQSDVTTSSIETHKMRLLEHDLWNEYVPSGIPQGMMVYHWRGDAAKAEGIEDFSAFVKMETRLSSRKMLFVYLLLAFCFGVLGNLVASAIWDGTHSPASVSKTSPAPLDALKKPEASGTNPAPQPDKGKK